MGALFLAVSVAPLTPPAFAQGKSSDIPAIEVSGAYNYFRANLISAGGCCFTVNGGSGGAAFNLTHWFGVEGEIAGYRAGNVRGSGRELTLFTYTAGPRLSLRRGRLAPFAHALFGGGHAGGTLYSGSGGLGANSAFVLTTGGGVDIGISPRVAIRVIQADYVYTRFLNGSNNRQNNVRIGAGLVFRLGSR